MFLTRITMTVKENETKDKHPGFVSNPVKLAHSFTVSKKFVFRKQQPQQEMDTTNEKRYQPLFFIGKCDNMNTNNNNNSKTNQRKQLCSCFIFGSYRLFLRTTTNTCMVSNLASFTTFYSKTERDNPFFIFFNTTQCCRMVPKYDFRFKRFCMKPVLLFLVPVLRLPLIVDGWIVLLKNYKKEQKSGYPETIQHYTIFFGSIYSIRVFLLPFLDYRKKEIVTFFFYLLMMYFIHESKNR